MQHTQLLALVRALAVALHAYVSVDNKAVMLYEQDRVLFQPAKLVLQPVPYTDGAYYVRLGALHFPPAFTPIQLRAHILTAWDAQCEKGVRAGFLPNGFHPREICK